MPDVNGVFEIGMNCTVELLLEMVACSGRYGTAVKPWAELGEHPEDTKPVNVRRASMGPT